MKSKTLIDILKQSDPTGEREVCVNNQDIFDVFPMPAYYDGRLQKLIRDENMQGPHNIVGAKYISGGIKINILPYSIEDAIMDNPKLPVDVSEGSPFAEKEVLQYRKCSARYWLCNTIVEYCRLEYDWDGHGGTKPPENAIKDALDFLYNTLSNDYLKVNAMCCSSEVGIYWNGYLSIDFCGDGTYSYLYDDEDNNDTAMITKENIPIDELPEELKEIINKLENNC